MRVRKEPSFELRDRRQPPPDMTIGAVPRSISCAFVPDHFHLQVTTPWREPYPKTPRASGSFLVETTLSSGEGYCLTGDRQCSGSSGVPI
jgi:hypothetical protein